MKSSHLVEEKVQTFMQMGLTQVQAKVYLSLFYMRQATIRGISQESEVSRQDIYQTLKNLERKGLVEKIISTPISYRPVPIEEVISILLQRRNEEQKDLQRKIDEMFQEVKSNSGTNLSLEEGNEFVLIPSKKCLSRDCKGCIVNSRIENAENEIDNIMSIELFKKYLLVSDKWYKPLERGAKLRFILNNPEKENPKLKVGFLKEKGSFEVRFKHGKDLTALSLIDDQEVILKTNMDMDAPALLSRNQSLVNYLERYFELLWNQALKN